MDRPASAVHVVLSAAAFAPAPEGLAGAVAGGALAPVERYDALFVGPRVREACGEAFGFDASPPRPARRRARPRAPGSPPTTEELPYDARIVTTGRVPSRPGVLHDLFNAATWAAFPRAKRVLHALQHELVSARATRDARGARTPAEDRVAMLDEGGVVLAAAPSRVDGLTRAAAAGDGAAIEAALGAGEASAFVFGHALLEALGAGAADVRAAVLVVAAHDLDAADGAVARAIVDGRGNDLPRHGTRLSAALLRRGPSP